VGKSKAEEYKADDPPKKGVDDFILPLSGLRSAISLVLKPGNRGKENEQIGFGFSSIQINLKIPIFFEIEAAGVQLMLLKTEYGPLISPPGFTEGDSIIGVVTKRANLSEFGSQSLLNFSVGIPP